MSEALLPEDPALDVDRRVDGPGTTHIDAADPAAPMYQLLTKLRKPVALRDIMIRPVRQGYAGQDLPDVATVLPPWENLFSGQIVNEVRVLSSAGPIRCQVYRPDAGFTPRPVLIYCHGGGFIHGRLFRGHRLHDAANLFRCERDRRKCELSACARMAVSDGPGRLRGGLSMGSIARS